jgi:hypothetical protein
MKRILLLALVAIAACGGGDTTSPSTTTPPVDGTPRVLLEVRDEGGFVPVEWSIGRMPRYVLMTDGTLYGPGAMTLEYPGRLLPSVAVMKVDESVVAEIRQYAEDIGFGEIVEERNDEAMLNVADAPDTVVTYFDDDGPHVFTVYGLGITTVSDVRVALIGEMVGVLDTAGAQGTSLGEFEPERFEVLAGVREIPAEAEFENERPWPLEIPFTEMSAVPAGWRCTTIEGEAVAGLLEEFSQANQATTWNDGGVVYTIVVRYLFPYQEAC